MSRTITSPVKRFSGSVVLPDALTYPQLMAWEQALAAAQGDGKSNTEAWSQLLPGILACVSEWHIAGMPERPTPETFPATPRASALKLLAWLMGEIQTTIKAEDDAPNA